MKETLLDMTEIQRSNVQYKADILESNQKRNDLQSKFEKVLSDHKKQLEKEYKERQQLINEKNEIAN